jgi:hypothetical protein
VKTLRALPDGDRERELLHVEIALGNPRNAWETLRCWSDLLRWTQRNNGARLTADLRAALLTSVSSRNLTWIGATNEAGKLLELPEGEVAAAIERLMAPPPARLDSAHGIYLAAARGAPPAALPRSPPHAGGPTPALTARGYVQVALLLGRRAALLVPPTDAKTSKAMIALAQKVCGWRKGETDLLPQLDALVEIDPRTPALRVVRAALLEGRHFLRSPDKVGSAVRPAAKTMMQLTPTAELLAALDDELCRADCEGAIERAGKRTSAPVVRAIWRGADAKRKTNIWLMALKDERWALFLKLKSRWTVIEGAPDDVLATVPAERFEEAVRAAQPLRPAR